LQPLRSVSGELHNFIWLVFAANTSAGGLSHHRHAIQVRRTQWLVASQSVQPYCVWLCRRRKYCATNCRIQAIV